MRQIKLGKYLIAFILFGIIVGPISSNNHVKAVVDGQQLALVANTNFTQVNNNELVSGLLMATTKSVNDGIGLKEQALEKDKLSKRNKEQQATEQPKRNDGQKTNEIKQSKKSKQKKTQENQHEEKKQDSKKDVEQTEQKQPKEKSKLQTEVEIPSSVKNIAKENTYPNPTQDLPQLQPSDATKSLIETAKVRIENPELIKILNETAINSTPFAIGYRAKVYLGKWPLNYESTKTSPNWEYQRVNTNYRDNRGNNTTYQINYNQEGQKVIKGGLTAKIFKADHVRKMMQLKATEQTGLPLSFETVIGGGTKLNHIYNIPAQRLGYLYAFAPAVNEKGKVTYGEVYLVLKGNKKTIDVKNITTQGIGAWIPVQDHLSFSFLATERPQ